MASNLNFAFNKVVKDTQIQQSFVYPEQNPMYPFIAIGNWEYFTFLNIPSIAGNVPFPFKQVTFTDSVLPARAKGEDYCATLVPGTATRQDFCDTFETGTSECHLFTGKELTFQSKVHLVCNKYRNFSSMPPFFCVTPQLFSVKVWKYAATFRKYIASVKIFPTKVQNDGVRVQTFDAASYLFCSCKLGVFTLFVHLIFSMYNS